MTDNNLISIGYSASSNISFHGVIDTDITHAEWNNLTDEQKNETIDDYTQDLIDIWVIGE